MKSLWRVSRRRRPMRSMSPALIQPLQPRQMLAGNVAVTVNPAGDILRIIGDNSANRIDVSYNDGTGEIVVTPTDSTTTINGGAMFAQAFAMPPSIRMRLADGSDSVTGNLRKTNPTDSESRPIIDEGFFRLGRGVDTFDMQIDYDSLVTVIGDSGDDTISLEAFNFDSGDDRTDAINDALFTNLVDPIGAEPRIADPAVRLFGFDGNDHLSLDDSLLIGGVLLDAGNDMDDARVTSSEILGQSRFDFGAGHDIGGLSGSIQHIGRLVMKGRTGDDIFLVATSSVNPRGNDSQPVRFDGDSGNDELRFTDSNLSASVIRLDTVTNRESSRRSGTFYFLGGTGEDRFYLVDSILELGGLEFEQGPDDDSFVISGSGFTLESIPFPDGTTVRGGGRFFARGRAGDDILAISSSVLSTTGKFIFDGDSDDDAVAIAGNTLIAAGNDILIEGNRGIDRVAISNSNVQAGGNDIDLILGSENDQVLLCSSAAISTTGQVTVNGEADNDEFAIDGTSSVPATASLVNVENPMASVAALDAAITAFLNTRATALSADPLSNLFSDIANSICS